MPKVPDMWKVQAPISDQSLDSATLRQVVRGAQLESRLGTSTKPGENDAIRRRSQARSGTPQLGSAQRTRCLVTKCFELAEH